MIQSDMTVLFEVDHPNYDHIRNALGRFAELEKSPEHVHTYRISPLSLWNAASTGMEANEIISFLHEYSKFVVPPNVAHEIKELYSRYGILRLERSQERLFLMSTEANVLTEIISYKSLQPYFIRTVDENMVEIDPFDRGKLKQELIHLGYPVEDLAGYHEGAQLSVHWRDSTLQGGAFSLRTYQEEAADHFYAAGSVYGGSGVLVLPCGAGKTVIGIAAAVQVQAEVLVLTSSITSARQWIHEFLDKTSIAPEQIGEYSGEQKNIRPITVTTYQILSYRKSKADDYLHLELFNRRNWGLIIYDEVHLLPAPVFRITADIQAKRRLGLTATLVREDGREKDVFSLIGPKKYDAPWKELEQQGWIATAQCMEVRVQLTELERQQYAAEAARGKARIAAEAQEKIRVVQQLVQQHQADRVLVIGQYLDQLERISAAIAAPIITGKTPHDEREQLYTAFRDGHIRVLVVSKVANFAVDLPDANVAVQVSGQYGSRQEEAQRLGRILRPKSERVQAFFYVVVTSGTKDHDFAINRQRFLTEQGYRYTIIESEALNDG